MNVDGYVATEFEPVLDAFAENFDERDEVGAAVCVYLDGRPVVDLWGGLADATNGVPLEEDTVVLVYSATKGVTSIVREPADRAGPARPRRARRELLARVRGERQGRRSPSRRSVPPGRAAATSRATSRSTRCSSWDPMVDALAAQEPIWEPGTKHGYHMRTFGWLVGEIIRRADPRTAPSARSGATRSPTPLGLDFWIGLPEEIEPRVARLVPPKTDLGALLQQFGDELLLARVFSNPGGHFSYDEMWNTRALHARRAAVVERHRRRPRARPACTRRASARSTARARCSRRPSRRRRSSRRAARTRCSMIDSCFGLGFMLGTLVRRREPAATAFGHAGAGGSLAFADPDTGLAFGYVMNDLRFDPRAIPAARSSCGRALPRRSTRAADRRGASGRDAVPRPTRGRVPDDVALDLVGSAPDGDRRRGEEERLHVAVRDRA